MSHVYADNIEEYMNVSKIVSFPTIAGRLMIRREAKKNGASTSYEGAKYRQLGGDILKWSAEVNSKKPAHPRRKQRVTRNGNLTAPRLRSVTNLI